MSLAGSLTILVVLAIGLAPAWLLRRVRRTRAQDHVVSLRVTRPQVVRNACIAYALRMAALGPLFAWGAAGDGWPVLVAALAAGLGIALVARLWRPIVAHADEALHADGSVTVHAYVARQHGDDPRVRVAAATLTLVALAGLVVAESLGLTALLHALLPGNAVAVRAAAIAVLVVAMLPALLGGHPGALHAAQLQLGILYLGLFGTLVLLLYLHVSALTPMPPHGALAILLVACVALTLLVTRRSRYVDADPVRADDSDARPRSERPAGARLVARFAKMLNACVSVSLVLVVVLTAMEIVAAGAPAMLRDAAMALRRTTSLPVMAWIALAAVPLVLPLVDVVHWQALAALARTTFSAETAPRTAVLRGTLRHYAVETALLWLVLALLGAVALVAVRPPAGSDVLHALVRLAADGDVVAAVLLPLLAILVLALVLSTIGMQFSAMLCTLRYDLLPASRASPPAGATHESVAWRRTRIAGGALAAAAAGGIVAADTMVAVRFASGPFLAALLAAASPQLALVPLVLAAIRGRTRLSGARAISVLVGGTAAAVASVAMHVATGSEAWLWATGPACLVAAAAMFALARIASRAGA